MKFILFDVNTLIGPVKRKSVYDYLNKMRTEVVFIEEGHLTKSEQLEVKREPSGQVMQLRSIQRQGGGVDITAEDPTIFFEWKHFLCID